MSFAIAVFCSREAFNAYHTEIGRPYDFDATRSELADKPFEGDPNFKISDVIAVSASYGGGMDGADISNRRGGDGGSE